MREPLQLHNIKEHTESKQPENADSSSTYCAHIDPIIDLTPRLLHSTTTNPGKTITPPYASDVMML
jgi:hypothetical protein